MGRNSQKLKKEIEMLRKQQQQQQSNAQRLQHEQAQFAKNVAQNRTVVIEKAEEKPHPTHMDAKDFEPDPEEVIDETKTVALNEQEKEEMAKEGEKFILGEPRVKTFENYDEIYRKDYTYEPKRTSVFVASEEYYNNPDSVDRFIASKTPLSPLPRVPPVDPNYKPGKSDSFDRTLAMKSAEKRFGQAAFAQVRQSPSTVPVASRAPSEPETDEAQLQRDGHSVKTILDTHFSQMKTAMLHGQKFQHFQVKDFGDLIHTARDVEILKRWVNAVIQWAWSHATADAWKSCNEVKNKHEAAETACNIGEYFEKFLKNDFLIIEQPFRIESQERTASDITSRTAFPISPQHIPDHEETNYLRNLAQWLSAGDDAPRLQQLIGFLPINRVEDLLTLLIGKQTAAKHGPTVAFCGGAALTEYVERTGVRIPPEFTQSAAINFVPLSLLESQSGLTANQEIQSAVNRIIDATEATSSTVAKIGAAVVADQQMMTTTKSEISSLLKDMQKIMSSVSKPQTGDAVIVAARKIIKLLVSAFAHVLKVDVQKENIRVTDEDLLDAIREKDPVTLIVRMLSGLEARNMRKVLEKHLRPS